MLTVFYAVVAACTLFVILSLAVVRTHEKRRAEKAETPGESDTALPVQEEEFFSSPIYRAMEAIAHL